MKDKNSQKKDSHADDRQNGKDGRNQKDDHTNDKHKMDVETSLRIRAATRRNYHNDGPGGAYDGL